MKPVLLTKKYSRGCARKQESVLVLSTPRVGSIKDAAEEVMAYSGALSESMMPKTGTQQSLFTDLDTASSKDTYLLVWR